MEEQGVLISTGDCKSGYEGRELRRKEGKGEPQPRVTPIYPASQQDPVTANVIRKTVLIKHISKIIVTGQEDDSASRDSCYQDQSPRFELRDPHDRRRVPTLKSSPLTSTYAKTLK